MQFLRSTPHPTHFHVLHVPNLSPSGLACCAWYGMAARIARVRHTSSRQNRRSSKRPLPPSSRRTRPRFSSGRWRSSRSCSSRVPRTSSAYHRGAESCCCSQTTRLLFVVVFACVLSCGKRLKDGEGVRAHWSGRGKRGGMLNRLLFPSPPGKAAKQLAAGLGSLMPHPMPASARFERE